ncbi:hypothetical protein EB151_09420 [archaeon]|nr:hypothetical protein [archaeon]
MKKLIGISGYARSGKDTFYQRSAKILSKNKKKSVRLAFADALKQELDDLLVTHLGISAFTEEDKEKELIRPLLVTYGTELRRKLNPNCWIESIQGDVIDYLDIGSYVFITDVRFENEAQWIHMNGGTLINVSREDIGPANHEEHKQSHRMRKYVNYHVRWPTYGSDSLHLCDEHIAPALAHLIQKEPKFEQIM